MKSSKELAALIVKKLHGEISEAEEKELEEYVSRSSMHKEIYDHVTNIGFMEIFLFDETMSNEEFQKNLFWLRDKHEHNKERTTKFSRLAYVYVAACLVGAIIYFFNYNGSLYGNHQEKFDIYGKWIGLRQVDGTIILLDSTNDRQLPDQGDYRLNIREDELIYTPLKAGSSSTVKHFFNTVLLPVGRHFRVTLPDGSNVCLNAASSIKFPVSGAAPERTLELQGEGLFSIVTDSTRPFRVKVNTSIGLGVDILVTGTKFNVNAYCDDSLIRTTLLEGHIKISNAAGTTLLKAGEEMIAGKIESNIKRARPESDVTAWKDDYFLFEDAPVQNVLNEIGRWYGWKVIIDGEVPTPISLTCPRNEHFDTILNAICAFSKYYIAKRENRQLWLKKNR